MQKHSLTLCLLIHDEEETVGRALKSALAIVDEVVAVDMGSSDNSRLIVEGYGARVVDHPYPDDPAGARNAGLAASYGDWILVMDAHELLEPARPVDLGRMLAERDCIAYRMRVRQEQSDGSLRLRDELRLFRNHPRARYRCDASARIAPALLEIAEAEGSQIQSCGLSIFCPPLEEETLQAQRRSELRALRQAASRNPDEPWYAFELARCLAVQSGGELLPVKGFSSVLEALDGAWATLQRMDPKELEFLDWLPDIAALRARALRAAGRLEESRSCVEFALDRQVYCSPLRLELGATLVELAGDDPAEHDLRQLAATYFEVLLDGPGEMEPAWVESSSFHLWPRVWRGRCAMGDADYERAREAFQEALDIDPQCSAAWCGLAQLAEMEGRLRASLQIYLRAMRAGDFHASAWLGGSRILTQLGFHDNAVSWSQRVAALQPEHPALAEDKPVNASTSKEVAAQV